VIAGQVGAFITNTTFRSNHATGQGGAVFITGLRFNLQYSNFISNYADTVNSYFTDSPAQVRWIIFGFKNS
jgi:predicted outer membrane repeat protein